MVNKIKPFILIILDGWGYREETKANAIASAHKPYWDSLWQQYPHTLIEGSGHAVGLPEGQMGNSEVGHLTMGAGRVVHQDLTRIDLDIAEGKFAKNPHLNKAIDLCLSTHKALHILGLVSPGGVHSHEAHIIALLDLAKQRNLSKIYLHAFLDGRDTPPQSAEKSLQRLTQHGPIASIVGRYYAMDRDQRWDRIEKAYDLITAGRADYQAPDALTALKMAYARGENDEFVKATAIHAPNQNAIHIEDGDAVIFMNFRADRARELSHALIDEDFSGFNRKQKRQMHFFTLTEYDTKLKAEVIYAQQSLENILGSYLSQLHLKQLRIAETEKYAHVTFFFNGGIEKPFPGEDRILIPSPKVATYDLKPEMSAFELTERLLTEIAKQRYDVIILNFANPDMVGHTGKQAATEKAIATVDQCLSKIIPAIQKQGGEALITADHGNAELMFDEKTQQPHTAHTTDLVPVLYIGRSANVSKKQGTLADISPTILYLLNLAQPREMTGQTLFTLSS